MMRFTIGFLLVYVAVIHSADRNVTQQRDYYDDMLNRQQTVLYINKRRQEFAKHFGITVPDLVWDDGLANQSKSMSSNCDDWMNTDRSRYAPIEGGSEDAEIIRLLLASLITMGQAEIPEWLRYFSKEQLKKGAAYIEANINTKKFTLEEIEIYNPRQTKIGCAAKRCEGRISKELIQFLSDGQQLKIKGKMRYHKSVCILEPSGTWELDMVRMVGSMAESLLSKSEWSELPTRNRSTASNPGIDRVDQPRFFGSPAFQLPSPSVTTESGSGSSALNSWKLLLPISILYLSFL